MRHPRRQGPFPAAAGEGSTFTTKWDEPGEKTVTATCGESSQESQVTVVKRVILLFGYWPPTDIGVADRKGMLWKWRKMIPVTVDEKTYGVLAISPTFPKDPPGGNPGGIPAWGPGGGKLKVDYHATSKDFWEIVEEIRPIAIMSFSRGGNDKSWELEEGARNLKQADWIPDFQDNKPHAGGSEDDSSPYKGGGVVDPESNPPDPTKGAPNLTEELDKENEGRANDLPLDEIVAAINAAIENEEEELSEGDIEPDKDATWDVGKYVSEYMAYHVAWYRDWSLANLDMEKRCHHAGHTHVGVQVDPEHAERAVEFQLEELIKKLNEL